MEMVKNAVNWFEIPVADFERAKAFYSKIFDFEMPEWPMGPVRMGIFLSAQDQDAVGGAICHGPGFVPSHQGCTVYLNGGADLAVVLGRVEAAGGKVLVPKFLITPEIGYCAFFQDSEGNRVGLHSRG
ncbi:MAG: VOC family protein [Opitutaceae bacterium]